MTENWEIKGKIMKITSENSQLLDEIFNDLKRKKVESEKGTQKVDGGMADVTTYINLANLTLASITTLITYLTYRQNQKKNYIHFKYKNGLEVKFDNLSKEELKAKEAKIREDIANDRLEYIYIG